MDRRQLAVLRFFLLSAREGYLGWLLILSTVLLNVVAARFCYVAENSFLPIQHQRVWVS